MTRRKSSPLPPVDYDAEEVDGYASPDGPVQDDIDLETRIFPSLPLLPELAEEEEYAADDYVAPEYDEPAYDEPGLDEPVDEMPLPIDPEARLQDYAPLPEPVSEPSALDALRARQAETPAPVEQSRVAPTPEPEARGPKPARFDELPPNKDYDTPEEVYDLDSWLADEAAEAGMSGPEPEVAAPQPVEPVAARTGPDIAIEPEPAGDVRPDDEPATEPAHDSSNVTSYHDDEVDGYAFMRDPRSRRAAVAAATPGQQSALRAKLLREAEEEAAAKAAKDAKPESKSLFASLWRKITGRR